MWIKVASAFRLLILITGIPIVPALHASTGQPARVSPLGHVVAEFSAATAPGNPLLMAATAIDSDLKAHTRCAVYVSRDGGGTWSEVPAWPETASLSTRYDPWVAIDAQGTIHAVCIVRTNFGSRVGYVQSTDQGATWTAPRTVTPIPGQFHRQSSDKCALGVSADGTVYVCYNQILEPAGLGSGLVVARSADQGLTWTGRNSNAGNGYCNGIVAAPGGGVTATYIINNGTSTAPLLQYDTVTSTDGGNNWNAPVVLGDVPTVVLPSIVRDATGRTIVAELSGQPTATHLDITIEDDGGAIVSQWQLPKPLSATCSNGRILHPTLAAGPSGPPALQLACKIPATASTAGHQEVWIYPAIGQPGTTPSPVLALAFALPPGTQSHDSFVDRFIDGGDYWGFTWRAGGWLAMWIDPRNGGGPGELWAAPFSAD